MRQTAAVVNVNGNKAVVQVRREEACSGCKLNKACFSCAKTVETEAYNNIGAKSGDIVEVETSSGKLLMYSAAAFIIPIILGITLYCLGLFLFASELAAYLCAAVGFVLPFFVLAMLSNRKGNNDLNINIVRIVTLSGGDPESRDNME